MGDIATHAEIAKQVAEALGLGSDAPFFEIGNWLTDVSQFRDPPGYLRAKLAVWRREAKETIFGAGALSYVRLDRYLDDLLGVPDHDGALALWFRELCLIWGLEEFRLRGVSGGDFLALYDAGWTQYYPHEHLDFPPWPMNDPLGDRSPSQFPRHRCKASPADAGPPPQRRLVNALDLQIVCLGDLLTAIETRWARAAPKSPPLVRREWLARYGHLSHAVEDFFFHSNFVEIAWAALHDGKLGVDDSRQQRIFDRRRRAPTRADSAPESALVFTGSFGDKDIFHTLMDAVAGLNARAKTAHGPTKGTLDEISRFLDRLFDGDETHHAEDLELHRRRLATGWYTAGAEADVLLGRIHSYSAASLRRMNDIDTRLARQYPLVRRDDGQRAPLGVVGFLQGVASMARKEEDSSEKVSVVLDKTLLRTDDRLDNGASAEAIGSHSLLAKDSPRKNPLRPEAVQLATSVAVYAAQLMTKRTTSGGVSDAKGSAALDWLHLLQHFLCHPAEAEGLGYGWWECALGDQRTDLAHTPRYIDQEEAKQRSANALDLRRSLERRYDAVAVDADSEWKLLRNMPERLPYSVP